MNEFDTALDTLRASLKVAQKARTDAAGALAVLEQYETSTAAEIAKYLRSAGGLELDQDAICASVTRPYTIIPQDQHKALLVHWRGVKMPQVFGWVLRHDGAFTISEISRGMDALTPFPQWMKDDMGWKPPEHQAELDGTHSRVS